MQKETLKTERPSYNSSTEPPSKLRNNLLSHYYYFGVDYYSQHKQTVEADVHDSQEEVVHIQEGEVHILEEARIREEEDHIQEEEDHHNLEEEGHRTLEEVGRTLEEAAPEDILGQDSLGQIRHLHNVEGVRLREVGALLCP